MTGNVAAFTCGRWHPQLGSVAPCIRQRHHAGDHRTEHEGSLKVWPDAPLSAGGVIPPRRAEVWPPLVMSGDLNDPADETWQTLEVDPWPRRACIAFVWLVCMAQLAWPALLVLLYRAAL